MKELNLTSNNNMKNKRIRKIGVECGKYRTEERNTYTHEQLLWLIEMDKLTRRKQFPTFVDVLIAAKSMGYRKII
jgi:hypothetical protein